MKHTVAVLAVVVVASLAFAPASFASQAKGKSTGAVTAIAADTVTVKVAGKDTTFKIDEKTEVVAKGGTTATKQARKEGMKGPKFADIVKVGDEVEVTYNTVAGSMLATDVRVTKQAGK